MKNMKRIFSFFIFSMMIVLVGCQSVAGIDLNKMLVNNMVVESFEGKQSIELEFVWNDEINLVDTVEDTERLKLLDGTKLDITSIKMQDVNTMSMAGALHIYKGSIPFSMVINSEQIILTVDGLKEPLVMNLYDPDTSEEFIVFQKKIDEKYLDITEVVGNYIVKNLQNPPTIEVTSGFEKINNQHVFLHKVHAKIELNEIFEWAYETLRNLVQDEAGFKEMLSGLYDIIMPIIEEYADPMTQMLVQAYIGEDKEAFIDEMYEGMVELFEPVIEDLDQNMDEFIEEFNEVFDDKSHIYYDFYVDKDLNIWKQEAGFYIEPVVEEPLPITAVKFTTTSELWNHNKPVIADEIDTSHAIDVDTIQSEIHFLKMLDEDSVLYKLLREDFKVTQKEVYLFVSDSEMYGVSNKPYLQHGTAMVPVRFISEELDAEVYWDGEKRQVTVIDVLTEKEIVITIDSRTAYVDGVAKELPQPAVLKSGTTYVPVRFIAESLGGTVEWDDELMMVIISRD